MKSRPLLALTLAFVAAIGVGIGINASSTTTAAWTDRSHFAAIAASGTWSNTCVAYRDNNQAISGCRISSFRYDQWGTAGTRQRNYYISFTAPSGTAYMTFDVDLTTAVRTTGDSSAMTWTNAGVAAGAQFTAHAGWTCARLPRVQGRTPLWNWADSPPIYFSVHENKSGQSVMCG